VLETPELLIDGDDGAAVTLVLAHGAGAPMDSPFMERIATELAGPEIRVVRFEFPYMARRRETGLRRGPDSPRVLEETWRSVATTLGHVGSLVIGGKSMGGRIASMVADGLGARGLVLLGYPFHPPGKPERLRTAHLAGLSTPTLIVQGTRDVLGRREEIDGYLLSNRIRLVFLEDGDHSFKPRKSSGRTLDDNLAEGIDAIRRFLSEL
jgi:predicted alpha/beta-hydrolase family hydrolase